MHLQAYFYFRRTLLQPDGSYGSAERLEKIKQLCRELRELDVNLYLVSSQPVADIINAINRMRLAEFFQGRGGYRIFHLSSDKTTSTLVRENISAHHSFPEYSMYVDSDAHSVREVQANIPGIAGCATGLDTGYDDKLVAHFRFRKSIPPSPTSASRTPFPAEMTESIKTGPYLQPPRPKGGAPAIQHGSIGPVTFIPDAPGSSVASPVSSMIMRPVASAPSSGYMVQTGVRPPAAPVGAAPGVRPPAAPTVAYTGVQLPAARPPARPKAAPVMPVMAQPKEMQAFFDFDNTLTKEMVFFDLCKFFRTQRPTAQMAKDMSDDWWISEFGGVERIKKIDMMLKSLRQMNVKCFICSQNYPEVIEEGLKRVGIAGHFMNDRKIMRILPKVLPNQTVTHDKGARIGSAMAKYSCEAGNAFFADDAQKNITIVNRAIPGIGNMTCPETGLRDEDFNSIVERFQSLSGADTGMLATSPSDECNYALFAHSAHVGADDSYFIPLHLLGLED